MEINVREMVRTYLNAVGVYPRLQEFIKKPEANKIVKKHYNQVEQKTREIVDSAPQELKEKAEAVLKEFLEETSYSEFERGLTDAIGVMFFKGLIGAQELFGEVPNVIELINQRLEEGSSVLLRQVEDEAEELETYLMDGFVSTVLFEYEDMVEDGILTVMKLFAQYTITGKLF